MERTLSIIKPDAVKKGKIGYILSRLEKAGLKITATKMLRLTKDEAETFYAIHRERPFFNELIQFMTSGPIVVSVLSGNNAINCNRELMGATNPDLAEAGTLRKELAESITRNAVHGSDAPETALTEINYFFSDTELVN